MSYPSASNVPVTEVVGANVRISWEAAYSGGIGIDVQSYQILIKDKQGNMVEDLDNCNGANDPAITLNLECFIPMISLVNPETYDLDQGDLLVAQIAARNEKGQGSFSGTNIIGALIEKIP